MFNDLLTGIGNQVYGLKKFSFLILYSGQCSLLAYRPPCHSYATVLFYELRFQFFFSVNKKFLSYAFSAKEFGSEYFEYLN